MKFLADKVFFQLAFVIENVLLLLTAINSSALHQLLNQHAAAATYDKKA
jgi:hypothetical protein